MINTAILQMKLKNPWYQPATAGYIHTWEMPWFALKWEAKKLFLMRRCSEDVVCYSVRLWKVKDSSCARQTFLHWMHSLLLLCNINIGKGKEPAGGRCISCQDGPLVKPNPPDASDPATQCNLYFYTCIDLIVLSNGSINSLSFSRHIQWETRITVTSQV